MRKIEERIREISVTGLHVAALISTGAITCLICKSIPNILALQKAEVVNKLADAHRLASLAKTYDARSAKEAINVLQELASNTKL